jgi:hypothetical protein
VTTLQPGDILLVHGDTPVDAAIRWATNSPYNHAAIVATDGASLIEAQTPVSDCVPASIYAGRADVWRLGPFANPVAAAAATIAADYVGKPYGYREALASGLWDVAHLPVIWRLRGLDCSGLVATTYARAGQLLTRKPFPAPGDLAWSAVIEKVGPWT